jgi:hypothetical protein
VVLLAGGAAMTTENQSPPLGSGMTPLSESVVPTETVMLPGVAVAQV